jgi:hypothetical protein
LFDEISRMINTSLNEAAQKYVAATTAIRNESLDAIEADIANITAPDTAIFKAHSEFA